jgi:hypothetical protein
LDSAYRPLFRLAATRRALIDAFRKLNRFPLDLRDFRFESSNRGAAQGLEN